MLQTKETAAQRLAEWFSAHPSVTKTDQNVDVLCKFLSSHFKVAGEVVVDSALLDLAYLSIGGTMEHAAGPEVQEQIAKLNAEAAKLLLEKQQREAAEKEEARKTALRNKRIAEQIANGPGAASAFRGKSEADARMKAEKDEIANSITAAKRHEDFKTLLRQAENFIVAANDGSGRISYSQTETARANMKAKLKKAYPEFASEIRD